MGLCLASNKRHKQTVQIQARHHRMQPLIRIYTIYIKLTILIKSDEEYVKCTHLNDKDIAY